MKFTPHPKIKIPPPSEQFDEKNPDALIFLHKKYDRLEIKTSFSELEVYKHTSLTVFYPTKKFQSLILDLGSYYVRYTFSNGGWSQPRYHRIQQ